MPFLPPNQQRQSTHTHPFNGPLSGTTQVSRYQKGKTNLDFTEARDSEWQWHQLGHMQICTSLQTDNHASTSLLSFLQAGCPSCHPTNSVKALKANLTMPANYDSASYQSDHCNIIAKARKHFSTCNMGSMQTENLTQITQMAAFV